MNHNVLAFPSTQQACVLQEDKSIVVREVPTPRPPVGRELLFRVLAIGQSRSSIAHGIAMHFSLTYSLPGIVTDVRLSRVLTYRRLVWAASEPAV